MLKRSSNLHERHGIAASGGETIVLPASRSAIAGSKVLLKVSPADDDTNRKNMALLIQLRWTAVIGQVVTIAIVQTWLGIALPLAPMAGVICALVTLNLASLAWMRYRTEVSNRELLLALMLDVTALTGQLYLSGGATNPFTSLYLLQVTLGAVLLDSRSTWSLVALTVVSFAGLTGAYRPLGLPHHAFSDPFSLHVAGMFIGFALDTVLLVVFVTRINRNLRDRDARLAELRQQAAEEEHIVRIGLLASGAAHELGTPLASLSVILGDWRRMPTLVSDPELAEDLTEMETSLQRCKAIVTGILVSAGEARGEESTVTTVINFITSMVEEWRATRSSPALHFRNSFGADIAIVSDAALQQAIFNVLDNAFEVSRDWVEIALERDADDIVLSVSDHGSGFATEMLAQLGKPYHSSKGRPGGGLGLFLVVNVIRKLGGRVTAQNHPHGATVKLVLPLAMLAIGADFDR